MITALWRSDQPNGFLRPLVPAVLLALTAACAAAHQAPRAGAPGVPLVAVPANWPTLTDATYGFSLRYPAGWTEKFDQPPGFHALASRADMASLLELQARDYWLVAQASAHDPTAGCGEPAASGIEQAATTLGGQPANRYIATGTRGDLTQHIIDVISLRGETCFSLQLVAGGAIPLDRALSTLQEIQASYRLGAG